MAKALHPRRRAVRSRRRGSALEEAVLQATIDELLAAGYTNLTMDRVAQRAGTNKNVIYRRWPSRAALAVAAYRQMVHGDLPLPDTGTLRDDVLEFLRRANRAWSSPVGSVQRSLLAGVADDPQLLALIQERANDAGSAHWLTILGRAVARGEAPPEALHPRVATLAVVLLRNEYVTRGIATAPDDVLVEIVEEVYLPLVRGRAVAPRSGTDVSSSPRRRQRHRKSLT